MKVLTLLHEGTAEYVRLRAIYHFGLVLVCKESESLQLSSFSNEPACTSSHISRCWAGLKQVKVLRWSPDLAREWG